MLRTKLIVMIVSFAFILSGGYKLGAQIPPPGGPPVQLPPPIPPQVLPCLSGLIGVQVTATTPIWTWVNLGNNLRPPLGMWLYVFYEVYSYQCTGGGISLCSICERVEVDYWSVNNSQWIVAGDGIIAGAGSKAECSTETSVKVITTYGWPYPAGTLMRATWQFAEFRPDISPDCSGQLYKDQTTLGWTIPADGAVRP